MVTASAVPVALRSAAWASARRAGAAAGSFISSHFAMRSRRARGSSPGSVGGAGDGKTRPQGTMATASSSTAASSPPTATAVDRYSFNRTAGRASGTGWRPDRVESRAMTSASATRQLLSPVVIATVGTSAASDGGVEAGPSRFGFDPVAPVARPPGDTGIVPSTVRAEINSAGVWNRSSGSRAISRSTTAATSGGMSDRNAVTGVGLSWQCRRIFSIVVPPGNGTRPVSRKYSVQPSEYRSDRVSATRTSCPCSGAM